MGAKTSEALGRAIDLSLTDPWELDNLPTAGQVYGTIIAVDALAQGANVETIAVRLHDPLVWQGHPYPIVVIAARQGAGVARCAL